MDKKIVAELREGGRGHGRTEAGGKVVLLFPIGERLPVAIEADDFQTAACAYDDAIGEDTCLFQRPGSKTSSQKRKDDRDGDKRDNQARDKGHSAATATKRDTCSNGF